MKLAIAFSTLAAASAFTPSSFMGSSTGVSVQSSSALEMRYKVAVVGGGPAGACAAEIFAQEKGIDTVMIERKLDNAKPCGGAIPLCMVGEFDIPESVVDRKVCCILVDCLNSKEGSVWDGPERYSRTGLQVSACLGSLSAIETYYHGPIVFHQVQRSEFLSQD